MNTDAANHQITITAREQAELLPAAPPAGPLGPTEVAGRTRATLVSAGTELAGYTSDKPESFPRFPGYAAVFDIEAVGDRVLCMGPHRSFQRNRQEDVVPVPKGLAAEVAVFARLMSVSMTTLATTRARPGDVVVVTGLGPVGHLAAKLFARCGYVVVACDPVAARRDLLAEETGIQVSSSVPFADPEWAGQVALVVECSGHEQAALDGCRLVRKGGEVVLVGVPWKRNADLYAHDLLHAVFHKYAVLRSGWEWELPHHASDFRPASIFNNLALALRWLADNRVGVEGLYEAAVPQNAQNVYQALLHGTWERLAAVFTWQEK